MKYLEYDPMRLDPDDQDRVDMVIRGELTTSITEDDLGVKSTEDKYSNIRSVFAGLEDTSEEGNERYDKTIASMLHIDSVDEIDWKNVPKPLSERIDKLYVYGRILFRLHEGIQSRITSYMKRTYIPQFRKTPLAMIQGNGLDAVLLIAIRANEG